MKIGEVLSSVGYMLFTAAIIIGCGLLIGFFIAGGLWLSEKVWVKGGQVTSILQHFQLDIGHFVYLY